MATNNDYFKIFKQKEIELATQRYKDLKLECKKNFEIEIDKCNSLLDYYQDIIIPSELSDYNPYEHETHLKLLNDKTNIDLLKYTNEYSKLKHIMLVELTFFNKLKKIQMDYEEYLNNLEKATLTPTNNMNDDASLSLNIENINESIENLEKEIASSNLNYKIDAVNLSSGSSSRQDDVSTASSTQTSRKNSKNSFDTSFKEIKSAREPLTQKSIINDDLNETSFFIRKSNSENDLNNNKRPRSAESRASSSKTTTTTTTTSKTNNTQFKAHKKSKKYLLPLQYAFKPKNKMDLVYENNNGAYPKVDLTHLTFINSLRDWSDPIINKSSTTNAKVLSNNIKQTNRNTQQQQYSYDSDTNNFEYELKYSNVNNKQKQQQQQQLQKNSIINDISNLKETQNLTRCKATINVPKTIMQCIQLNKSRPKPSGTRNMLKLKQNESIIKYNNNNTTIKKQQKSTTTTTTTCHLNNKDYFDSDSLMDDTNPKENEYMNNIDNNFGSKRSIVDDNFCKSSSSTIKITKRKKQNLSTNYNNLASINPSFSDDSLVFQTNINNSILNRSEIEVWYNSSDSQNIWENVCHSITYQVPLKQTFKTMNTSNVINLSNSNTNIWSNNNEMNSSHSHSIVSPLNEHVGSSKNILSNQSGHIICVDTHKPSKINEQNSLYASDSLDDVSPKESFLVQSDEILLNSSSKNLLLNKIDDSFSLSFNEDIRILDEHMITSDDEKFFQTKSESLSSTTKNHLFNDDAVIAETRNIDFNTDATDNQLDDDEDEFFVSPVTVHQQQENYEPDFKRVKHEENVVQFGKEIFIDDELTRVTSMIGSETETASENGDEQNNEVNDSDYDIDEDYEAITKLRFTAEEKSFDNFKSNSTPSGSMDNLSYRSLSTVIERKPLINQNLPEKEPVIRESREVPKSLETVISTSTQNEEEITQMHESYHTALTTERESISTEINKSTESATYHSMIQEEGYYVTIHHQEDDEKDELNSKIIQSEITGTVDEVKDDEFVEESALKWMMTTEENSKNLQILLQGDDENSTIDDIQSDEFFLAISTRPKTGSCPQFHWFPEIPPKITLEETYKRKTKSLNDLYEPCTLKTYENISHNSYIKMVNSMIDEAMSEVADSEIVEYIKRHVNGLFNNLDPILQKSKSNDELNSSQSKLSSSMRKSISFDHEYIKNCDTTDTMDHTRFGLGIKDNTTNESNDSLALSKLNSIYIPQVNDDDDIKNRQSILSSEGYHTMSMDDTLRNELHESELNKLVLDISGELENLKTRIECEDTDDTTTYSTVVNLESVTNLTKTLNLESHQNISQNQRIDEESNETNVQNDEPVDQPLKDSNPDNQNDDNDSTQSDPFDKSEDVIIECKVNYNIKSNDEETSSTEQSTESFASFDAKMPKIQGEYDHVSTSYKLVCPHQQQQQQQTSVSTDGNSVSECSLQNDDFAVFNSKYFDDLMETQIGDISADELQIDLDSNWIPDDFVFMDSSNGTSSVKSSLQIPYPRFLHPIEEEETDKGGTDQEEHTSSQSNFKSELIESSNDFARQNDDEHNTTDFDINIDNFICSQKFFDSLDQFESNSNEIAKTTQSIVDKQEIDENKSNETQNDATSLLPKERHQVQQELEHGEQKSPEHESIFKSQAEATENDASDFDGSYKFTQKSSSSGETGSSHNQHIQDNLQHDNELCYAFVESVSVFSEKSSAKSYSLIKSESLPDLKNSHSKIRNESLATHDSSSLNDLTKNQIKEDAIANGESELDVAQLRFMPQKIDSDQNLKQLINEINQEIANKVQNDITELNEPLALSNSGTNSPKVSCLYSNERVQRLSIDLLPIISTNGNKELTTSGTKISGSDFKTILCGPKTSYCTISDQISLDMNVNQDNYDPNQVPLVLTQGAAYRSSKSFNSIQDEVSECQHKEENVDMDMNDELSIQISYEPDDCEPLTAEICIDYPFGLSLTYKNYENNKENYQEEDEEDQLLKDQDELKFTKQSLQSNSWPLIKDTEEKYNLNFKNKISELTQTATTVIEPNQVSRHDTFTNTDDEFLKTNYSQATSRDAGFTFYDDKSTTTELNLVETGTQMSPKANRHKISIDQIDDELSDDDNLSDDKHTRLKIVFENKENFEEESNAKANQLQGIFLNTKQNHEIAAISSKIFIPSNYEDSKATQKVEFYSNYDVEKQAHIYQSEDEDQIDENQIKKYSDRLLPLADIKNYPNDDEYLAVPDHLKDSSTGRLLLDLNNCDLGSTSRTSDFGVQVDIEDKQPSYRNRANFGLQVSISRQNEKENMNTDSDLYEHSGVLVIDEDNSNLKTNSRMQSTLNNDSILSSKYRNKNNYLTELLSLNLDRSKTWVELTEAKLNYMIGETDAVLRSIYLEESLEDEFNQSLKTIKSNRSYLKSEYEQNNESLITNSIKEITESYLNSYRKQLEESRKDLNEKIEILEREKQKLSRIRDIRQREFNMRRKAALEAFRREREKELSYQRELEKRKHVINDSYSRRRLLSPERSEIVSSASEANTSSRRSSQLQLKNNPNTSQSTIENPYLNKTQVSQASSSYSSYFVRPEPSYVAKYKSNEVIDNVYESPQDTNSTQIINESKILLKEYEQLRTDSVSEIKRAHDSLKSSLTWLENQKQNRLRFTSSLNSTSPIPTYHASLYSQTRLYNDSNSPIRTYADYTQSYQNILKSKHHLNNNKENEFIEYSRTKNSAHKNRDDEDQNQII